MRNSRKNYFLIAQVIFIVAFITFSCTRELEDLEPATFPANAEVFIDGFSAGLAYVAFGDSKVSAFSVDNSIRYAGESSMQFAVPDADDPEGGYAGGAFITSVPRDLSGFDALTFWIRASQGATIDELTFGNDLGEAKFAASLRAVPVNSNWQKIIIPLPDPSKLTQERGLLQYAEAPENGKGYTFWIDEVQFEKLGTLAHEEGFILEGQDQVISAETGQRLPIGGTFATFNLPTGVDQRVDLGPAYYNFSSSNSSVATVGTDGIVSVIDSGMAVITATFGDLDVTGSMTVQSIGQALLPPEPAPTPTVNSDSVISMYSNVYNDVVVDTWNPFWEFSTTQDAEVQIGDDDVRRYQMLNFVGILTESEKIDATEMTHFHMDIWTPDPTDAPRSFKILLVDFGADGNFGGGDDSSHEISITAPTLQTEAWVSLDIPLTAFAGLINRNNIAQLVLSGDLPNIFVDNVYYYIGNEDATAGGAPEIAAPTPPARNEADVISLFSDAYNDVTVDTWRTDWSASGFEDVEIDGNPTKKYSGLDFVGIETVNNTIDINEMTHVHMDVWSADFTDFSIKLVDFGANGTFDGGDDTEHQIDFVAPIQGEWVSYDIPISDFVGLTTKGNLAQYILVGRPQGLTTVYVDNFYFYKGDGGGTGATEPEVAAPAPTQDASNVISIFSDAYNDVTVDTWRTDWSSADFEDVEVAGNATKKYSALDFVGIETVANTVDASAMTHFHIDVWSADADFFGIKLVDTGADGVLGGGDDVEHQVDFEAPAKGGWVSYDIPLTDFVNLTTRGNIAQYILVGRPTGQNTIWVDNMFFYGEGGGGSPTEPNIEAPTPTQAAGDVISIFSDAYDDVTVDTWRTDWSAAEFEDVMVNGNAAKKYAMLDFVGIETVASTVDASAMTHFHIDVWSADYNFFGIKLVDTGADGVLGGGDDVEHQVDFDMPMQGGWVSFDIPLTDFVNLTSKGNIAQYILVGRPTGENTIWVDNMFFYTDGSGSTPTEPNIEAPAPTQDAANVISIFSDAYDDVTVDTWRTDWSSAEFEDVTVNGNAAKKYAMLDFVGIETVASTVDASAMTHFHIDVWSADYNFFGIKLVDTGADGVLGGGDDVEHQVDFDTPAQGGWVSFDIPLTDFVNLTTRGNIAQYILVGRPTGENTIWVDNMYFYGEGSGGGDPNAPDIAAPTPTLDAANVISLFSDAYDDVTVDTWRTDWSSAEFEDIMVAGNATKKYSSLDFVGIETVANTVDATGMTHFHIDVWSSDFILFGIKLVDFGEDGVFGNGDDVEHQINFDAPAQGEWISYDIPLSDFTGLTKTGHIAQYILVGQPVGENTIYVDNVYFHN